MFSPKKILIINIFGIGDVLFTTPLISNLKSAFPHIQIGYLCNRRTEPILKNNPKIDRVFVYERDEFNALYRDSKAAFIQRAFYLLRAVKNEKYDAAIDVSLNGSMSFLTWCAGIPQRIGFNYKNRSLFLSQKIPLEGYEGKHVVQYYLGILKELGLRVDNRPMEFFISPQDTKWADDFFETRGIAKQKNIVGLIPGGGASWGRDATSKRWPAPHYAKLADKIVEKFKAPIILMGDVGERDLCQQVALGMKNSCVSVAGETSLAQFAALASKCALVVANDGGPLHVAVAAGAKTVSIFGPVDQEVYGPFPQEGHGVVTKDLACRPCYRYFRRARCSHISCLNQITVEDVFRKVEELL